MGYLKGLIFCFFLSTNETVLAQDIESGCFLMDRRNSYLQADTLSREQNGFPSQFKNSYLNIGGEVRYQTQWFKNEDWGDGPKEEYLAFYTRFLLHGDFQYRKFRFFAQLNSTFASGRPTPNRPIDENRLSTHQLFFDFKIVEAAKNQLSLRIGRQELVYGSERLITVREGPNNRLSFDALKLYYKSAGYSMEAFYAAPVQLARGVFDDEINRDVAVWATYGTVKITSSSSLDHYYLGFKNSMATFNGFPKAEEIRHSLGLRWWGEWKGLTFDLESLVQFGNFSSQKIKAFTASANLLYVNHQLKSMPGFGLKAELISGDRVSPKDQLETFNPMFPRGAYFGLAALIGPVNLVDIHPSFQIKLNDKTLLSMDYDIFWRYSINDGIYGPNVQIIYSLPSKERHIGNQLGINLEYIPNPRLSIVPEFTWFQAMGYLKDVSPGKDVLFSAITVQYKF